MPSQSDGLVLDIIRIYKKAGIELPYTSAAVKRGPLHGEMLPVSWTDNSFIDVTWRERSPNPASAGNGVTFGRFPHHHAWTARFLIWAMENAESSLELRKAKVRTGSSARAKLTFFKPLVSYMQAIAKPCILNLSQEDLRIFMLQWCGLTRNRTPVMRDRALEMLIFLRQLHDLGPAGDYWIPDGLSFDPQPILVEIVNHSSLRSRKCRSDLSENAAHRIVSAAIYWVEELASPLSRVQLTLQYSSSGKRSVDNSGSGLIDYEILQKLLKLRKDYEFLQSIFPGFKKHRLYRQVHKASQSSHFEGAGLRATAKSSVQAMMRPDLRKAEARASNKQKSHRLHNNTVGTDRIIYNASRSEITKVKAELRNIQVTMTGMCYVIIAAFTGWRISEILSVERGFLNTLAAGLELGSKIRKTGVNPEIVTYRPVPPVVGKAVRYLEVVNAGHFAVQEKRIFRRVTGTASDNEHINLAIKRAFKYVGVEVSFSSHRFRHFFALFYLRRFQGNIDALRRNFRHISREMVWSYAQDVGNAEYLSKAEKSLALEITEGIISGGNYRSRRVAEDVRIQYKALNLPPREAERWLRQELERNFLGVHPMPFGYCLFQKGSLGAACDAKSEPVLARAGPSTCGGCNHFVSGRENVEFWQTTALLHKEIVESDYQTPILKASSRKMLKICHTILARHGMVNTSNA